MQAQLELVRIETGSINSTGFARVNPDDAAAMLPEYEK